MVKQYNQAYLFYIRAQFVPRIKHSPPGLYKTNMLMLYKAKFADCSDIRTKCINVM